MSSIETRCLSSNMKHIIAKYSKVDSNEVANNSTLELDSHTYSPVVDIKVTILYYTDKSVRVSGFTETLG